MSLSAMSLAIRMAWRDARRATGRSALVIVLIALPIAAMTAFAGIEHSFNTTDGLIRSFGAAEARLNWEYESALRQDPTYRDLVEPVDDELIPRDEPATVDEVLAVLPPGSSVIEITADTTDVVTPAGIGQVQVIGVNLTDPMTDGIYTMIDGTVPGAGEVAISRAAADRLQLNVGETIDLVDQKPSVTAIVEDPADLTAEFIVGDAETVGGRHQEWLVDTVAPITWNDVLDLNEQGITVLSKAVAADPPPSPVLTGVVSQDSRDLMMIAGVAALAVLEVVLLAGPALAIGAKRRIREFGLMVANGATPAQIRHTILAGGLILAVIATLTGIVLGVFATIAAVPFLEDLHNMRSLGVGIDASIVVTAAAIAVVSGLLAAMVPAFITSRQVATVALAGRRGTLRSRKRWVVVGLVVTATGAGTLWSSISGGLSPTLPLGIVLVELGLVLCTPALVGLIARVGRYLPLSPRLALRDASRNRAATAPAISAVMAVVAVGAALSMLATSDRQRFETGDEDLAEGTTVVALSVDETRFDDEADLAERVSESEQVVGDLLLEHLPVSAVGRLFEVNCHDIADDNWCRTWVQPPREKVCPYAVDGPFGSEGLSAKEQRAAVDHPQCNETVNTGVRPLQGTFVLPDADHLTEVLALEPDDADEATAVLAEGGVLVTDPDLVDENTVTVDVRTYDGHDETANSRVYSSLEAPGYAVDGPAGLILLSPEAGEALNIPFEHRPVLVARPDAVPTQGQIEALNAGLLEAGLHSPQANNGPITTWVDSVNRDDAGAVSPTMLALAAITGLLALAATAVATALAAAESRRDLVTLGVIGASPGIRRRLTLCQAAVVSILGAGLGLAVGVGFTMIALAGQNAQFAQQYPLVPANSLDVPWAHVLVALVAVPAVAMLGAGLFTRSRIPSERRSAI